MNTVSSISLVCAGVRRRRWREGVGTGLEQDPSCTLAIGYRGYFAANKCSPHFSSARRVLSPPVLFLMSRSSRSKKKGGSFVVTLSPQSNLSPTIDLVVDSILCRLAGSLSVVLVHDTECAAVPTKSVSFFFPLFSALYIRPTPDAPPTSGMEVGERPKVKINIKQVLNFSRS